MIEINNLTKITIKENSLKKIAKKVFKKERKEKKNLSIALVGQKKIKELNKKYRKRNLPTDVLTFSYDDFGEIVICPQVIRKNSKKFGLPWKKEIVQVLIHGILHFLGYNHKKNKREAKKMADKQNYYFELCQKLI